MKLRPRLLKLRRPKKGSALAMVLLFVSTFALMTAGVGDLVTTHLNNINKSGQAKKCRYVTYAAIQMALQRLNQDRLWSPGTDFTNVQMPGCDPAITYTLVVYNNWQGGLDPNPPVPGVPMVPQYMVYLKAESDFGSYRSERTTQGIASMGYIGDSYWNMPAVGTDHVTMTNCQLGPQTGINGMNYPATGWGTNAYTWANIPFEGWKAYFDDADGRICTNGTQAGAVTLANSPVYGNVTIGPNGVLGTAITMSGTGACEPPSATQINTGLKRVPRYVPPFDPSGASAVLTYSGAGSDTLSQGAYNSLSVTGGHVLTLNPGNYYFAQSILVNGSTVNAAAGTTPTNPVSIYTGSSVQILNGSNVNLALGFTNAGNANYSSENNGLTGPATMRFFWVGNGAPGYNNLVFQMDNSTGSFVAAGKGTQFSLTNGSVLYGAVKGYSVEMNNAQINYDTGLFNYLNMGTVAWSLQGLVTDSGDTLDQDGMGPDPTGG